jgi:DNA-binding SARP family transcriptional activator/tetratricopeptide (TPR) repeat protein
MEFRILGALEVRGGGRRVPLGAGKQRATLAILLLHANQVVPTERLIDELWAENPPDTARKAVQVYVTRLRKALGPERIRTHDPGYVFELAPDELDVHRFERLLREGRELRTGGDPEAAARALREALALWRGAPLADFTYEPFAQTEIARLEELHLTGLEERIEAELALGHGGGLVAELEALATSHPFRERLRGLLMLALYQAGRQADALAAYQETRHVLVEELGIEPSPALQRLERAILRHEQALDVAVAAKPAAAPAEPVPPREVRKTVTVIAFGPAETAGSRDPEVLRRLRRSLAASVSRTVSRHGGAMTHSELRESLVAVFGVPVLHEDDALRAVRSALEAGEQEHPLRAGIETGEVVVADGEVAGELLATDVAESAVRLRDAAGAGEIVLGEATRNLVGAAVRVEEAANGWRVVELVPEAARERLEAPFVGRSDELAQLRALLASAVQGRTVQLVTVLGVAGIGKSRLVREFASLVDGEATVLRGRCLPYGEGITFWPLREILQDAAGEVTGERLLELLAGADDAGRVAELLAAALGLVEPSWSSEEEIFWAVRRLLETLAHERPLVVVLEDFHWAESTFLDLVEHLAEWTHDAPLLVVCLARPELLEERPLWGGGKPNASSLLLEPLGPEESETMLETLPGGARLSNPTRARIADLADGNPLFLEQLAAEGDELSGELPMPPTIEALLAARLDRLGPAERTVLETASVVGKEFWTDALSELLPPEARPSSSRHLATLVRKQLVRPAHGRQGRAAFRFGHILIQQAAYRSVPMERRANLHERFARWLTATAAGPIGELDELVGYHLEQAALRLAELGFSNARVNALADEASDLLAAAARRAAARGDQRATVNLLRRARSLLSPGDPRLATLGVPLADALTSVGDLKNAETLSLETQRAAAASGDLRTEWLAVTQYAHLRDHLDPQSWNTDEVRRTAQQALAVFEDLGDDSGLARAWRLAGYVDWNACHFAAAAKAYERQLFHARRAEDEHAELDATSFLIAALYYGPTPAHDAIARIDELTAKMDDRALEANALALAPLAGLHTMEGHFEEGRSLYERSQAICRELGLTLWIANATMKAREIHLLAGDVDGAERELRWGYDTLDQMGEKAGRSTLAANLAEALYQQARYDEAEEVVRTALEESSPEDVATQVMGRAVMAKILGVKGVHDEAEQTAREAVALAERTDDLFTLGQAHMALAEVHMLAERREEAIEALEAAAEASDRKGNLVTAEQARAQLAELGAGTGSSSQG